MPLSQPPENGWHTVDIRGGRWRNAEGVEWGIRGPVDALGVMFEAESDCIYHVQEKCGKSWADGCRLHVKRDSTDPSQIVSFRWLSDTYYRDDAATSTATPDEDVASDAEGHGIP